MKAYLFLLSFSIIFFLFFLHCGQLKSPIGPVNSDLRYPLKINNQWEYARSFIRSNIQPDTVLSDTALTINTTHVIKVTRKAILQDSIETFVLKESSSGTNWSDHGESFYSNEEDGLYFHAYDGQGFIIPKVSKNKKFRFKDIYFDSIQEISHYITKAITANRLVRDSLIHEIPPLLSLMYPLKIGAQWTYRPDHKPWRIDKKIIGLEKVEVPVGIYICHKIQWLYDFNHDGICDEDIVFYDFICEAGLLKRSITFLNVLTVGDPGSPQPLLFDVTDESVLTSFSL